MIYLLCLNKSLINIIDYIYSIIEFSKKKIKLIIKNNENDIFNFINDNLKFIEIKKYIIVYNNSINFDEIKNLDIKSNSLYILNSQFLNNELIKFYINIGIPIIDFNISNINFAKRHNLIINYLPYQINLDIIIINEKRIDILFIHSKNRINRINNLKIDDDKLLNIDFLISDNDFFANIDENSIYQYKIILFFNTDNNTKIFNSYELTNCILNKIIVIFEKSEYIKNHELSDFILQVNNDDLPDILKFITINYDIIYNKIFYNFEEKINNIQNKIRNIGLKTIRTINLQNEDDFGFILLRHVISFNTNLYWQESYKSIRKFYSNKIIIIDDSSKKEFLKCDFDLVNCEIVNSEYNYRGEILPYFYFFKYNYFNKAVIIQDSVFFNKYMDINNIDDIMFLWHFEHHWDNDNEIIKLFKYLNLSKDLRKFFNNKKEWVGCFGVQSIIEYDFLKQIVDKYNIFNLLNYIDNREKRMAFERIFALICFYEKRDLIKNKSLLGIIHHYIHWGYTFENYLNDKKIDNKLEKYDLIKVWSGR